MISSSVGGCFSPKYSALNESGDANSCVKTGRFNTFSIAW